MDLGTATYIERRLVLMTRGSLLAVALVLQIGIDGTGLIAVTGTEPVERAVYLALLVVGVACAVRLLVWKTTPNVDRWVGIPVLLTCSVVISAHLPLDGVLRAEHWSLGLIGWYGLVLLFDVSLGWSIAFLAFHLVVRVWPMLTAGATLAELAAMGVVLVSVLGFQFGIALGAVLLRNIALSASHAARDDERLRTQEEVAAAVAHNHERRYADLHQATIPLLAGLACGELNPLDATVRRRCAVEAAKMRRLFSEQEDAEDRLVHELGAIIDVAERHGASVQLSVRGSSVELSEGVRRALLTPISEALVTARSEARVTVIRTPDQIRVSARCAAPGLPITRPDRGEVELVESVVDGQLWLEMAWRSR